MKDKQLITIEGSVEHIVFQSEDTGFNVLELCCKDELITVVGELGEVSEGEELKLTGQYTAHATYGTQFKATLCERSLPANESAIFKYLSAGAIKGVGPVIARRLVDYFGKDTLEIIEKEPARITEVKGISPAKAKQISMEFQKVYGIRNVMMKLSKYRISTGESIRVWKKFGLSSIDMISENPYILCNDEIGVTFERADQIAEEMGFASNELCRIRAGLMYVLRHNLNNGHTYLPITKLISLGGNLLGIETENFEEVILGLREKELLADEEVQGLRCVFLPHLYSAERYISNKIALLATFQTDTIERLDTIIDREEGQSGISYAKQQRKAIKEALTQSVFILTGGPGTGKTTTLNGIISLLEQQGKKVLLAAPTGRAAKRLSEVTGREAKTIHRLLEVTFSDNDMPRFSRDENNPLNCNAVIIDEISMVDVLLFEALLRAVSISCKLILVGDADQLPSVGAGCVLRDMIESECVPQITLSEVFRQAAQSMIVTNAHAIVSGDYPDLESRDNDFFFIKRTNATETEFTVVDLCNRRLPTSYGYSPMWDIQVLTPSRKGQLGTVELNIRLQEALNPPHESKTEHKYGAVIFRQGDKVMQIKNNYDLMWVRDDKENGLGVFNGDIGVIERVERSMSLLTVRFDDRVVDYPFDMLEQIEHAYAITVHKSQGSEFESVVMPLFQYFDKLYYRNLLYTAVTRAKKMLILVGKAETILHMVDNNRKTKRYTALKQFLQEDFGI